MASRMIHYTISKIITDRLEFNDKNKFIVGSLAPDMVREELGRSAKRKAHFYERHEDLGLKGYNWLTFYHKYLKENVYDEFVLGYFTHLICDSLWVKDINLKYRYSTDEKIKNEKLIQNYEDMRKSNYNISQRFSICYDSEPLEVFSVNEADINYQREYLDELKQDFLPYGDDSELKTLNFNDMISYIDKAVNLCLKQIELVINGEEPDNPIEYMIPINLK